MKKHILVIDDTKILAKAIAELLSLEGFAVSVAYDGAQGLAMFKEKNPDLIVTDLLMAGMDGFEVIQHIRSGTVRNTIPIIIVTADTNVQNEVKATLAGANLLLHKPFDEEHFIDSIKKLLENG